MTPRERRCQTGAPPHARRKTGERLIGEVVGIMDGRLLLAFPEPEDVESFPTGTTWALVAAKGEAKK